MTKVEERDFELLGDLEDEQDALESLMNDYDSGYVCDNISEIADNYIPIYTHDLWKNAYDIKEHIEEAISQGLCEVRGNDIDLDKIFQAGYYQYYTQSLYNNLNTIAFNMVAKLVNEKLDTLNQEMVSLMDIDAIEREIEFRTEDFDNNNQMSEIQDIANEIIEEYLENLDDEEEED